MLVAARTRRRGPRALLRDLPPAMLLGLGVAFSNTVSMLRGLFGRASGEFERTPKTLAAQRGRRPGWTAWVELGLALYVLAVMALLTRGGHVLLALPLALYVFAFGGIWLAQRRSM